MGVEVRALHCDCRQSYEAIAIQRRALSVVSNKDEHGVAGSKSRELLTTPFWSFYRSPKKAKE